MATTVVVFQRKTGRSRLLAALAATYRIDVVLGTQPSDESYYPRPERSSSFDDKAAPSLIVRCVVPCPRRPNNILFAPTIIIILSSAPLISSSSSILMDVGGGPSRRRVAVLLLTMPRTCVFLITTRYKYYYFPIIITVYNNHG